MPTFRATFQRSRSISKSNESTKPPLKRGSLPEKSRQDISKATLKLPTSAGGIRVYKSCDGDDISKEIDMKTDCTLETLFSSSSDVQSGEKRNPCFKDPKTSSSTNNDRSSEGSICLVVQVNEGDKSSIKIHPIDKETSLTNT